MIFVIKGNLLTIDEMKIKRMCYYTHSLFFFI